MCLCFKVFREIILHMYEFTRGAAWDYVIYSNLYCLLDMLRNHILLLIFCCFLFDICSAQNYNIETITAEDGLNASDIYDIHQDSKGYLWIATYGGGVSRYDGVEFTHFTTANGLADDKVLKIFEDRKGNIWFATYGGGVSCYENLHFKTYNEHTGLAGNIVNDIAEDKDGNLWFACNGKGISRFNGTTITSYPGNNDLDLRSALCLAADHTGKIWIGRDVAGVAVFDGKRFSLVSNPALAYSVWDIAEDVKGRIWFGMYGGGASSFDGKTFVNYNDKNGLDNNIVYSVFEDKQGKLWFGTDGGGANIFDGKTFSYINKSNGLSHDRVRCIRSDSEGNIWLGTEGGVCKFPGKAFVNYNQCGSLPDDNILSLFEDRSGNLWVGTFDQGVSLLSLPGDNSLNLDLVKRYTTENGLSHNRVWKIMTDSKDRTWFGTARGLCMLKDNKISMMDCGLASHTSVYALMEDHSGRVWVGTDRGLHAYENGICTKYTITDGRNDRIRSLVEDRNGNIWIGTYSGGVIRYDGKNFLAVNGVKALKNAIVYDIKIDDNDCIWFATYGQGIVRYDPERHVFNTFAHPQGLSSNAVFLLVPDSAGCIWVGTTRGLDKLSLHDLLKGNIEFSHYGFKEGFKGVECNQAAGIRGMNGNVWFGTKNGLIRYITGEDNKSHLEPRLHIRDIRLFYEKENWEKYSDGIDKQTGLPINLVLPYNKNHLTFNFTGISFTNSMQVKYRFRLKDFDENWSPESNVSHAVYSNLPPGHYTFEVMACNSYGIWTRQPLLFSFTIRPPFWRTDIAYITFVLIVAGIFFTVVKLRTRSLEREKSMLTAEISKRKIVETKLTETNKELETFMYKASHDIRAPLSSTMGLINLTKQENNREQVRGYIGMIENSIKRLDALLLDILETARIKTGNAQYERINWENLVHDILTPYVPAVVKMEFEVVIQSARSFYSDRRLIDTMLRNLIDNSINYSRREATNRYVRIHVADSEKGVLIRVEDNGIGISAEVRDHVFDMFYRGTEVSKGTGLGLYIVKNIVDRLEGTIKLESVPGSGTKIIIYLPSRN